LSLKN